MDRTLAISSFLAAGLAAGAALAQGGYAPPYPPVNPPASANSSAVQSQSMPPIAAPATSTGARAGNEVGTGMSEPRSSRASNINTMDTRSTIAPNLPSPSLGPGASAADYLRAAQSSLAAGRTGEAQQALEMAQTRLLDRSVAYGQTNEPDSNPAVRQISDALQALAANDRMRASRIIQDAIPAAQAATR